MTSLIVSLPTWFLAFYGVWGNLPAADPAEPLSIVIGHCTVDFNMRYLRKFRTCLFSSAQTCGVTLDTDYFTNKAYPIWIDRSGSQIIRTGSSGHYICDVSCRKAAYINYDHVDSFTCNRVESDEYDSQCKEGLQCDKSIYFGSTETPQSTSCVDIRWRSSDKINVLLKNQTLVQYGKCPSKSVVTTGVPTTETSVDLSSIPSNGSEILNNATVLKITGGSFDSKVDLIRIIVPLSFTIVVVVLVIAVLIIYIFRLRSKALYMQHSGFDYIAPVDIIYDSAEFLVQENPVGNQLAQLSTLDRRMNINFAVKNEYSDVSYPDSRHILVTQTSQTKSCDQIPVNQASQRHADACFCDQVVNEYAEAGNIYSDLEMITGTSEDSNKTHYANMSGLYPNDSASVETTIMGATSANPKDSSQAATSEGNYSIINDCVLKHNSLICESVSTVCSETEGAYKVMKPTTTNFYENTKNRHTFGCNSTQLGNNYTRLREHHEDATNVYDVLVTEADDLTFKSDLGVYLSMVSEDKESSKLCPLHGQQCSEKDRLDGNLYENDNGRPNATGNADADISHPMSLGIHNNCTVGEDKIVEPDSTYVNCTDRGNQRVESPSTCYTNDVLTNNLSFKGDPSIARSCAMNNRVDSNSCNDEKDNPYVEMMQQVSSL